MAGMHHHNPEKPSLAVLMTCHNRVQTTTRCLELLFAQHRLKTIDMVVYLVDDGSTDSTGEVIRQRFPQVKVLDGDGTLYWNRGTHRAFSQAHKETYDYYLWLNDDTFIYPHCIDRLITTHRDLCAAGRPASIVVGSTCDPESKKFTYGGYVSTSRLFPLNLELKPPSGRPQQCRTMCGNCVLIPRAVVDRVGMMDPAYRHRWGDIDYGLRTVASGGEVWIAPGFMGECRSNPQADAWRLHHLSLAQKARALNGIKGLGKRDWYHYVSRHGGRLWFLMWLKPYFRILVDSTLSGLNPAGRR